jgi:ABC-type sugar transport system ATPase subunit
MTHPVLQTRGLNKTFGPVKALSDIDFDLLPGEIHALVGVNGAGKSAFIKILSGVYMKDDGEISIDGAAVDFRSPRDAIDHGVATVQQHPELVGDLDGYQNIFLGREGSRSGLLAAIDHKGLKRKGDALLARFPVGIDLSRLIADLSVVEREVIAVLQALSHDGIRVMILDEPSSTLTEVEKGVLFRMMRALKDSGIAIIYITHRLEEVAEVADRFTVFRGSRRIATMNTIDIREKSLSVAELMLGDTLGHVYPPKRSTPAAGDAALAVQKLRLTGVFDEINFEARLGEIVGIFGLIGSGLDELSKAMFGVKAGCSGAMNLAGRAILPRSPGEALRNGIFLCPGNRRTEGLTLTQSTSFNIRLADLERASGPLGLLRGRANHRRSRQLVEQVALTPPNLDSLASSFSGGNQQKIVVAKGLYTEASVYIFVEPTVGVDIGARSRLYALMRGLAEHSAVIVMSSDCDEVHGLSDRCFALYKGRQVCQASAEISRNQLLTAGTMGKLQ